MTDTEAYAYYRRRAEQADVLADRASEPHIKRIHQAMAIDYRALSHESRMLTLVRPTMS